MSDLHVTGDPAADALLTPLLLSLATATRDASAALAQALVEPASAAVDPAAVGTGAGMGTTAAFALGRADVALGANFWAM